MTNLYDFHGRTSRKVGKVQVSILPMFPERAIRIDGPPESFKRPVPSDSLSVFLHADDYFLVDLRVFKDGVIECGRLPQPERMDLVGLQEAVAKGRILSSPPPGATARIDGLGTFRLVEERYSSEIGEIVKEVSDVIDKLNHRPNSGARCRQALEEYERDPTEARRNALREAYEQIPEHNRRYVGDMDTKDIPVRMIIYGEDEIEGWSHRIVARATGEQELPTITVPQPKKP